MLCQRKGGPWVAQSQEDARGDYGWKGEQKVALGVEVGPRIEEARTGAKAKSSQMVELSLLISRAKVKKKKKLEAARQPRQGKRMRPVVSLPAPSGAGSKLPNRPIRGAQTHKALPCVGVGW